MIDILLATYNGEKYLNEQIESLLNQTYEKFKVLIHDDGSIDKTVDIIRNYQNKYPEKIIFFDDNISTGSTCKNFSYLLQKSTSNYIMFCDQDDFWKNNKIHKSINKLKEVELHSYDKGVLVFSNLDVVDENLCSKGYNMFELRGYMNNKKSLYDLMAKNYITGNTILINKKAKKLIMPISDNAVMHDWWIALILQKYGKIESISECLTLYRQHSSNVLGISTQEKKILTKLIQFLKVYRENISILKMLKDLPYKINYFKYFYFKIKSI